MTIDMENDLEWNDIKDGCPQHGEKVVLHSQGVWTASYELGNEHPPKGKWVLDKPMILNDTRFAYIDDEYYEKIKKEYW